MKLTKYLRKVFGRKTEPSSIIKASTASPSPPPASVPTPEASRTSSTTLVASPPTSLSSGPTIAYSAPVPSNPTLPELISTLRFIEKLPLEALRTLGHDSSAGRTGPEIRAFEAEMAAQRVQELKAELAKLERREREESSKAREEEEEEAIAKARGEEQAAVCSELEFFEEEEDELVREEHLLDLCHSALNGDSLSITTLHTLSSSPSLSLSDTESRLLRRGVLALQIQDLCAWGQIPAPHAALLIAQYFPWLDDTEPLSDGEFRRLVARYTVGKRGVWGKEEWGEIVGLQIGFDGFGELESEGWGETLEGIVAGMGEEEVRMGREEFLELPEWDEVCDYREFDCRVVGQGEREGKRWDRGRRGVGEFWAEESVGWRVEKRVFLEEVRRDPERDPLPWKGTLSEGELERRMPDWRGMVLRDVREELELVVKNLEEELEKERLGDFEFGVESGEDY